MAAGISASASPLVRAAGPADPFRVGLWTGGAYFDKRSGTFSDCAASIGYSNGLRIAVSLSRNWEWTLSFYDPLWVLDADRRIPLQITIPDRGHTYDIYATPIDASTVAIAMPFYSRETNAFRLAYRIDTSVAGQNFAFHLINPAELMGRLVNCVGSWLPLEPPYPATP